MTAHQFFELCEAFVDANGLPAALQELANVCHTKAEHLRANWQDKALAKTWDKAGDRIERAAESPDVIKAGVQ